MQLTLSLLALVGAASASLAPPAHLHRSSHRDLIHPHYSHPRPRFVEVGGGARALPRAGRRMKRDSGAQATLKCLTAYTFALCDESDCTDMGSVAAGTMCKDGAITWDTADEASTDDSSSASSEVESFASTSVVIAEAAASPSSSSSSIVLHNAAVNTDTSSSYVAPTTTSAPAAETSSSSSDWDDEGDCEEESSDSDDGWTSTTSKAPVANYATTSSTKAYVAPTTSSEYKAPSSSSTTQYVAPTTTTTTQAAATTSSPDSGSGASSEVFTGGRGTFYYQYGAYGACGQIHADSDPIVALAIARYGTGSNNAPDCGRKVVVTNVANGKSVTATVADACPGCANYNSLDMSTGAFDQIADEATGVIDISWYFSS